MNIELRKIKNHEFIFAWLMQKKGFKETLERYHDYDISPATESLKRFMRHFLNSITDNYWVIYNGRKAGAMEIAAKSDFVKLGRFYILPEYCNRGIGQEALKLAERKYPDVRRWRLDTIFEEKNNVHLYEKLGYIAYGERKVINDKMTIINYEKDVKQNEQK